jgi:hypothetical protein
MLMLAGCGGSDSDSGDASPSTSKGASVDSTALISADSAPVVNIEDRLISEIEVDENPGWLVEGFGSLWVKEDHGEVLRVNPGTGKITSEIDDGDWHEPICQGLGVSDDAIWSCPREGVVSRIDPDAERLDMEIRIDKTIDQTRLVSVGDAVWVLTHGGEKLTPIDQTNGKFGPDIDLGSACADVAASADEIWVSCYADGRVLRVDPEAGEVVSEAAFEGARSIALSEDLWVGTADGVAQVDPESLELVALYDAYPGIEGSIFAGEDVWVRESAPGPFLTHIDPKAQEVVETIDAPELETGGDVLEIGDSVWATAYDDLILVELSAQP